MTFPAMSDAPDTVAVYVAELASAALGVNVAVSELLEYATVPAMAAPPAPVTVKPTDEGCTFSLNVADTVLLVATPVAPEPGVVPTTVGGVVSAALVVNTTSKIGRAH